MTTQHKIAIIGAGNVGAHCAYKIAQKELGSIVLLDVVEGIPQGKALDMMQAGAVEGFHANIHGTNDYKDIKDSEVVVITAGLARKPGMLRDDLVAKNSQIMDTVIDNVKKYAPNSIIIVVSNPLDVMTHRAWKRSGFPHKKVMGMAPILDAGRMQYQIAKMLNMSIKDVYAEVLGCHGDLMVPIPRFSTAKGKPITEMLTEEQINNIVEKTKQGGAEIVKHLKTGSAYYAPGSSAAKMVEAILKDAHQIMGVAAYLDGQYGLSDVFLGVPARIGRGGVEEIVEIDLDDKEIKLLHNAAEAVRNVCEKSM
ncbi:MAG: malate dehydrogenase [Candidatus Margulisiibacteriota bacterium]